MVKCNHKIWNSRNYSEKEKASLFGPHKHLLTVTMMTPQATPKTTSAREKEDEAQVPRQM